MKIKQRAAKQLNTNLRWHSLVLLDKVENHNEYSNVVIDDFLKNSPLEDRDNRLVVQIVYGVIQNRLTIDYYLEPFIKGKKIEPWVNTLLRLSIYQLVYLDRIPNHAVVNEAVNIGKTNGHGGLGNFVNAILRNFMRQELSSIDDIDDIQSRLSIKYSIGSWIVGYLLKQLPLEEVESLLTSLQSVPNISARVNTYLKSRDEVIESLESEGYQVHKSELSEFGVVSEQGNLIDSTAFKEGWLTIQDESSMLVAPLGQLEGGENVLDACAAPGGKATHIASLLSEGHLTALDISERKLKRVEEHLVRLHLDDKVSLYHTDASKFVPNNGQKYDTIYLDAPCSGLGLMRRKPEIKYDKSYQDVTDLVKIQTDILEHVSTLLKEGGKIVYSTCTITKEENEEVLNHFLTQHPDFDHLPITSYDNIPEELITAEGNVRVWPHQYQTDGFFIGRIVKKAKDIIN